MPIITDNLAARVVAIILGSFVTLAVAIGVVMAWPRPGDVSGGLFKLPVPQETAAIVDALEASPPPSRPLVVRALNTSIVSVHLAQNFPPVPPGLRRAPKLEWMFQRYSRVLGDRPFRVDVRRGLLPAFLAIDDPSRTGSSVQLSIRLRDGAVLVIERRPAILVRSYIARSAALVALVALILLGGLALAVRQTARPVQQLAIAARGFSIDGAAADLPLAGPRELRELTTALNDMQHRIRGLVDERTRVLAAIAHDLRTYLTRLRLRADFIADDDQRVRGVRDIEDMTALLDDTLLFAQQNHQASQSEDVCDAVAEIADYVAVRQELGDKVGLTGVGAPPAYAACAPLALRRMLSNLVDNAVRYGAGAQISVLRRTGYLDILVEDDGPGVPPDALERLMRPFERLESSRARATGGAGLGLSIVKGLAESVGGSLGLENRSSGGLRATLTLRLIQAEPV